MEKIKNFIIKKNIDISWIILSIFIELFAVTYTGCIPLLTRPLYPVLILTLFILIASFIKKDIIKIIYYNILSIIQLILNIIFIFQYDSNGTVFEWAMYNQRNDGFGSLETYELQFTYLTICIIAIIINIIINIIISKKIKKQPRKNKHIKTKIVLTIITILLIIAIPYIQTKMYNSKGYTQKINDSTYNNYQTIGIIGNTFYQIIRGKATVNLNDLDKIDNFIYENKILTSQYNGISKDNNLILILVESFEWYPLDLFEEHSQTLFPNLTKLLNESLIGTNFYQKEKTDVSEALAVLGNYPTGQYINYDFPENNYPFSLPNLIKEDALSKNTTIKVNSFHANYGTFYNRYTLHQSWGFDKLYAIDEMKEYGVTDTWQHKKGERNLDSITFEKMKEVMFPKEERFFSYILSFTMHGYYGERENLKPYYQTIDKLHLFDDKNETNNTYLKTYTASLMDFDKAIGVMMDYLEQNNQLEDTTIILFSDHNSYYNKLSNYAKNIEEKYTSELFRIPFIMYDQKLYKAYTENENTNKITKFTTTSDITPTILDIFGIDGYQNLYFGNSIFTKDIESIIYSRNYNIFITDKFVGYSLKTPISTSKDITQSDLQNIEKRAKIHLQKLQYIDKIYYSNYFKTNKYR